MTDPSPDSPPEITPFWREVWRDSQRPVEPTRKEAVDLYSEVMAAHDCQTLGEMAEHFARAVLSRWGVPANQPVPVNERLPGVGDCDAEGRCWLTSVDVEPGWVTDNPEQCTNWTHWLPHWALPVPAPNNTINQED